MKLLGFLALACTFTGLGFGEMPAYYRSVNSVTWLVQNIDVVKPGWVSLGPARTTVNRSQCGRGN
jgi:hypothetical protein